MRRSMMPTTCIGSTPGGYLHHGATNCGEGDYAESARLLIAAGIREWTRPSGNPAMDSIAARAWDYLGYRRLKGRF